MKKNIIIAILTIFSLLGLYSWQKPPVEYVVIIKSDYTIKYWSNERKIMVNCGTVHEAMNQLSYYGYKFKAIASSQAIASNGHYNFTETIIMEK